MFCTKNTEYAKRVYLFVSSNPSPCYNQIDFPICTSGEVFDRLVGVFFEVNTKYISSSELKTSEFSRVRSTSEQ